MDHVAYPAKAARLLPVAINRNCFARQGLVDKTRQDHAISAALARPNRVEQANDYRREASLPVISNGEKFIERLGTGITPASAQRRANHEIVVFAEGNTLALSINF
jgi:hypothetical protein